MTDKLTHFDKHGNAIMVDVTEKEETSREARAMGSIHVSKASMQAVLQGSAKKGDVLNTARIAGIMGTKRTSDLIPLCHPLPLGSVSIDFETDEENCTIRAICTAKVSGKTGVEMEALTGVTVALLTIYDMLKAIDKKMELGGIRLLKKSGGKSGEFIWDEDE